MIALLAQVVPPPEDDIYDIVILQPKESILPTILLLGILLLLLIGLFSFIWWFLKRGNQSESLAPAETARRRLEEISRKRDELESNEFSIAVSDALKDFLSETYDDPIRYETAQEFLQRVSEDNVSLPDAAQGELRDFLAQSEEIKFGRPEDATSAAMPLLGKAQKVIQLCGAISSKRAQISRGG